MGTYRGPMGVVVCALAIIIFPVLLNAQDIEVYKVEIEWGNADDLTRESTLFKGITKHQVLVRDFNLFNFKLESKYEFKEQKQVDSILELLKLITPGAGIRAGEGAQAVSRSIDNLIGSFKTTVASMKNRVFLPNYRLNLENLLVKYPEIEEKYAKLLPIDQQALQEKLSKLKEAVALVKRVLGFIEEGVIFEKTVSKPGESTFTLTATKIEGSFEGSPEGPEKRVVTVVFTGGQDFVFHGGFSYSKFIQTETTDVEQTNGAAESPTYLKKVFEEDKWRPTVVGFASYEFWTKGDSGRWGLLATIGTDSEGPQNRIYSGVSLRRDRVLLTMGWLYAKHDIGFYPEEDSDDGLKLYREVKSTWDGSYFFALTFKFN